MLCPILKIYTMYFTEYIQEYFTDSQKGETRTVVAGAKLTDSPAILCHPYTKTVCLLSFSLRLQWVSFQFVLPCS